MDGCMMKAIDFRLQGFDFRAYITDVQGMKPEDADFRGAACVAFAVRNLSGENVVIPHNIFKTDKKPSNGVPTAGVYVAASVKALTEDLQNFEGMFFADRDAARFFNKFAAMLFTGV